MLRSIAIFLLLVSHVNFSAANSGEGEKWYQKALEWAKEEKIDSALIAYEKAAKEFEKRGEWEKVLNCYQPIVKSLVVSQKSRAVVGLVLPLVEKIKKTSFEPNTTLAETYVYLALSYNRLENYPTCLEKYESAIELFEALQTDIPIVAYAYKNAAQTCSRMLERDKQKNYLQKALKLKNNEKYIASIYNALLGLYADLGIYDSAYLQYQLGLKEAENAPFEAAKLKANAAEFLLPLGKSKEALQTTQEALDFFIENDVNQYLPAVYASLANIYTQETQKDKAIFYFNKALSLYPEGEKSRDKASLHTTFGDALQKWGNNDKALQHYQQALIQVFPNFNEEDPSQNPPLKEVYQESWIMTAAAQKAGLLQKRYEKSEDIGDLKNAADSYDLSLKAVQYLHQSYSADTSKHYLSDYTYNYYEQALHTNFLLYTQTQEKKYLNAAFRIMEQSKAKALKEAMVRNRALQQIPDSLRWRLNDLQLAMWNSKGLGNEKMYDSLKLVYERFEKGIHTNPVFAKLFHSLSFQIPNIEALQKQMPTTHFVEYFWGEQHLYLLQISSDNAQLDTLAHFKTTLQSYLSLLQNKSGNAENYPQLAYQLYQNYWSKWVNVDESKVKTIAIVPDGLLNFLPFEALLTDTTQLKDGSLFSQNYPRYWSYLLYQTPIQYAYSATILLQNREKRKETKELLGFFPNFEGSKKLDFQDADKVWFQEHFEGKYLMDEEANVEGFTKYAPKAQVIHLSTHAYASDAPRIDFADSPFSLSSLYAMQLSADLVVLSACETGAGVLLKGEGAMSLSRGFVYSGASNLMASLWSVDEESTQYLMQEFYRQLAAGQPKATALYLAKLKYLHDFDARSNDYFLPYYWAGMVYIGQNTPTYLQTTGSSFWLWFGGFGIVLLFAVGLYWRIK
ncbi:MAG: CHAT domain-containing protein [Chitinophagales bacterium]